MNLYLLAISLYRKLKFYSFVLKEYFLLGFAFLIFLISNRSLKFTSRTMIQTFCFSSGRSNDFMANIISKLNPKLPITKSYIITKELNADEIDSANMQLEKLGYFVFPNKISLEVCNKLKNFALTNPSILRPMDGQDNSDQMNTKAIYDPQNPMAVRYDFEFKNLINLHEIQEIVSDNSILLLAQAYLKTSPILDYINMWWQTAYSKFPDNEAAQAFHFDMERIRWLKFFIYLGDVGPNNGPHTFISGSHSANGIPKELLQKGYARLSDSEVEKHYKTESIIEFNAECGTVIVEDTRGLHKGKNVIEGDRLLLQIQFSNCLFGIPPGISKNGFDINCASQIFIDNIKHNPKIYRCLI